jgi:DMSO/TMAO reductase YedYZ molybdopterin-dependent catalytic subunit
MDQNRISDEHHVQNFIQEHIDSTRRYFLKMCLVGASVLEVSPLFAEDAMGNPELQDAIAKMESWVTPVNKFRDVSRGKPKPHSLSDEKRAAVGLTRESWKLQVISDSEYPAKLGNPLSNEHSNSLDFAALMEMARTKSVRFAKVMTCLNLGCPLGMGIWEGVPMRDIVWLTQPTENLRRIFYYGYHNDDEQQMFRSSLPIGRVLEDTNDLPPVILCFKLNGEWLSPERGGPVRVVVPEAYGFKSVKWLTHLVLSNISHANDTYANQNNDVDSDLKTFCATLSFPNKISANQPIPITGWAQAGISGLAKVQVWIQDKSSPWASNDRYFSTAPWRDAKILGLPENWSDAFTDAQQLRESHSFSATLDPRSWPLRLSKAHWAYLHPGLPAGSYVLRCRTIDNQGAAQPMPRPFRKSGHAAIETQEIVIR